MHDEDLFVDLKLNYMNDQDREIQMMFANPEGYAPQKKGREFDSMPFFLSDEFKSILEDKIKGTSGPSDQPMSLGGT